MLPLVTNVSLPYAVLPVPRDLKPKMANPLFSEVPVSDFFIQYELDRRNNDQRQQSLEQINIEVLLRETDRQRGKRHAARRNHQVRNKAEQHMIGLFEVVKGVPVSGSNTRA